MEKSDLVADLIDFMLGSSSPRAQQRQEKRVTMGGTVQPPFQHLYSLVSFLIRMTHTSQMELEERLATHVSLKPGSQFEQHKSYFLSEEAYIMLTKTNILDTIIFDAKFAENKEFAQAMAHICYRNLKFSRKLAKKLLKCISFSSNDQVERHLAVIDCVSRVKDAFQIHRLEYLFGFGFLLNDKPTEDCPIRQYGLPMLQRQKGEEAFQILSPLDARQNDDALLNMLWKYKGRLDSFTLTCLQSLTELLTGDDDIAFYFAELPSPTYSQARYTDWIRPYFENQLEDTKKYPDGVGIKEK
mmetsp:Transcript_6475/g.10989  ORF Transcript_6475/g.10989 Transcript_6475/m.10989 type:complete len:299 (+) Transcript_6475:236-1132(+)